MENETSLAVIAAIDLCVPLLIGLWVFLKPEKVKRWLR